MISQFILNIFLSDEANKRSERKEHRIYGHTNKQDYTE